MALYQFQLVYLLHFAHILELRSGLFFLVQALAVPLARAVHARRKFLRILGLNYPPAADGVALLDKEVYLVVPGRGHFVEVLLINFLQVQLVLSLAGV